MALNGTSSFSINPLGAGDLIDRAIRFYRNNFWTFVLIASPPVIIGTIISVCWTIIGRYLFDFGSDAITSRLYSFIFSTFGNLFIFFFEGIATLIVMGGASRNFVRHILFDEKITFRQTFANVRSRFFGLLGASTFLILLFAVIFWLITYLGLILIGFTVIFIVAATSFFPLLAQILSILVTFAGILGIGWVLFLIFSRFAYVPQVMLVEGQGVFAAISRSFSLAGKNVKRLIALFLFTIAATYSALLLFYVPLGWYAYANGLDLSFFAPDTLPAWYVIATQIVSQASLILLLPVWMIGLCLLYVDERVRKEGYDIELMAARILGDIPALPKNYQTPLQPAVAAALEAQKQKSSPDSDVSLLGLR